MKNILLVPLMLIIAKLSFCQENNSNNVPPPLYVVITASGDTVKTMTAIFAPNEPKNFNFLKGENAINKYGSAGQNGFVEIEMKDGTEILDLNALKKIYKLSQYKKVNITIDGKVPPQISIGATKNGIREIKRKVLRENEEISIDIITIYEPVKKTKAGEIVIRQ